MRVTTLIFLGGLICATPAAFAGSSSTLEDDAQTFAVERNQRVQSLTQVYMGNAKAALEQAWSPPPHSGLEVTKIAVTLDKTGKILSRTITSASSSSAENASVDRLLDSVSLSELPNQIETIALDLSFMSDGSVNIVKVAPQSPEKITSDEIPPIAPSLKRAPEVAQTQPQPDFGGYMEALQLKLKQCWFPPRRKDNKRVVVRFGINQYGALTHFRLDHSSGVTAADQSALKAVKDAAPFKPLPAGAPIELEAQFVFGRGIFGNDIHGTFLSL
jgi:TonB family protein